MRTAMMMSTLAMRTVNQGTRRERLTERLGERKVDHCVAFKLMFRRNN